MSDPWDDAPEPRDAAVHFEAVKIAATQNKDGYVLKLSIHPNEVPESLMRDWVGSRYTVAMVKMDDDQTPIIPEDKKGADRAVQIAGMTRQAALLH